MVNHLITTSLYTALKLISPKKRKPQNEVSISIRRLILHGTQMMPVPRLDLEQNYFWMMQKAYLWDGLYRQEMVLLLGEHKLPHRRGVTAAINLRSGCIPDRHHVKLHSGAQQAFLQVSKMLKNKEYEGLERFWSCGMNRTEAREIYIQFLLHLWTSLFG